MALYLDSVDTHEAQQASRLGFIAGATTNPILVAQSGRSAEVIVAALCEVLPGTVFHQVISPPGPQLDTEVARFRAISDCVGLKIPCQIEYLAVVNALAQQRMVCAVTGIFSPAQAYMAAEAGAAFVIPYVNRATRLRLCGDGPNLVAEMAAVLNGRECQILAASIKNPAEAVATLLAGAQHLTLPWQVLTSLANHHLTDLAMEDFAQAAK